MRGKIASLLLAAFLVLPLLLGCGQDTPTVVSACPSGSLASEVEVWRDRAILVPRNSSRELLSSFLWQGIEPAMSRADVEALLASNLRSRETSWSEFETPLGRLRWSLDREFSGGDEAKIPRVYLYPRELSLNDVLSAPVVDCLRKATPRPKYVVVMRSNGKGQLATLVMDGPIIKRVIWRQLRM